MAENDRPTYCCWFKYGKFQCPKVATNANCCDTHQYAANYTDTMKEQGKDCIPCRRHLYWPNNDTFKSCEKCRERGKLNRIIEREKTKDLPKCTTPECPFKAKDNGYCKKHQRNYWKYTIELDITKKVCSGYLRGCKNILDSVDKYTRCEDCRKVERQQFNKRRNDRIEENEKNKNDNTVKDLFCVKCLKYKDKTTFFTSKNESSNKCGECLIELKELEKLRVRFRNYATYEKWGRDIVKRLEWKKVNHEKILEYSRNYRRNIINTLGIVEYNRQNTEQHKIWRQNNPDKILAQFQRDKANIFRKIGTITYSAKIRNIPLKLTRNEIIGFIQSPCHYCGKKYIEGKFLNGIDRINNTKPYTLTNSVSCCDMCNYMKGNRWNDEEFLLAVEHILTYNDLLNGNLYYNLFRNYSSSNYGSTKYNASKKEIDFKLSSEEFNTIKNNNCYICGKKNTKYHNNGIDRIDNNMCYVSYNCNACCGNCNYMKKNYEYSELFRQMYKIYMHSYEHDAIEEKEIYSKIELNWNTINPALKNEYNESDFTNRNKHNTGLNTINNGKNQTVHKLVRSQNTNIQYNSTNPDKRCDEAIKQVNYLGWVDKL